MHTADNEWGVSADTSNDTSNPWAAFDVPETEVSNPWADNPFEVVDVDKVDKVGLHEIPVTICNAYCIVR